MSGAEHSRKEIGYYEKFSRILEKPGMANWDQTGKDHMSSLRSLDMEPTNYEHQKEDKFTTAGMRFTLGSFTGNVYLLLIKFDK